MAKVIETILGRVKGWTREEQEELMRFVLDIETRHGREDDLDDEDWRTIKERQAAAQRGDIATEAEVAAVFDRYRG